MWSERLIKASENVKNVKSGLLSVLCGYDSVVRVKCSTVKAKTLINFHFTSESFLAKSGTWTKILNRMVYNKQRRST